ncbi:MAG: ornithine carbamoyltransferase [Acidimicrobiia bacterium]|nr:ornithine carbamoyltransferase [Acidimicrobiia bacterium]
MSSPLSGRSFVKELDHTPDELRYLLDLADELKAAKGDGTEERTLDGKSIALLFEKTSTRTRAAFEVAAYDQGAHVTYFDPSGSQMGHKESIADTGRVLGRMYDAIQYRGEHQADVERLAATAGVPVYNGLTDEWHPTQMLADFQTMREESGKDFDHLSYAFVGDCRFNMARSHVITAALLGSDLRLAAPDAYRPPSDVLDAASSIADATGASISVHDEVRDAVDGVDFIHTDVWVSMGEPKDVWGERVAQLGPYQVDSALMAATGRPDTKFMHCLPAFHDMDTVVGRQMMEHTGMLGGLEVTDEVFESEASVVFAQAENRLHTIKAILVATLAE